MLPIAELPRPHRGTLEPERSSSSRRARHSDADPGVRATAHVSLRQPAVFLSLYYANLRVLKSEADFYDLAGAYLTRRPRPGSAGGDLLSTRSALATACR